MARYSPATTIQCSRLHLISTFTIHVARPCQCTLTPHYVQPGTGLATWLSLHWWHAMLAMMDSANRASPSDAMVGSLITSCSTAHPRQLPWNTVSRHQLRRGSLVKDPQNEDRLQDHTCALHCCCKSQNATVAFISRNAFATQQHCLLLSFSPSSHQGRRLLLCRHCRGRRGPWGARLRDGADVLYRRVAVPRALHHRALAHSLCQAGSPVSTLCSIHCRCILRGWWKADNLTRGAPQARKRKTPLHSHACATHAAGVHGRRERCMSRATCCMGHTARQPRLHCFGCRRTCRGQNHTGLVLRCLGKAGFCPGFQSAPALPPAAAAWPPAAPPARAAAPPAPAPAPPACAQAVSFRTAVRPTSTLRTCCSMSRAHGAASPRRMDRGPQRSGVPLMRAGLHGQAESQARRVRTPHSVALQARPAPAARAPPNPHPCTGARTWPLVPPRAQPCWRSTSSSSSASLRRTMPSACIREGRVNTLSACARPIGHRAATAGRYGPQPLSAAGDTGKNLSVPALPAFAASGTARRAGGELQLRQRAPHWAHRPPQRNGSGLCL